MSTTSRSVRRWWRCSRASASRRARRGGAARNWQVDGIVTACVQPRVLRALTVLLAVDLIAVALFRFVGDPINKMVGQDTGERDRAELRKNLGLDEPFVVQFA